MIAGQDRALRPAGLESFHIVPCVLGGSPTAPQNRAWLTRAQHVRVVRYWNRILHAMKAARGAPAPTADSPAQITPGR
ncbi:MAG: hypothetical protein REI09_08335 [Candidatus Dactylopiibacterium sp.]|nr:hypothetical protein [Candidatus Dactylopiibacterium sp.]